MKFSFRSAISLPLLLGLCLIALTVAASYFTISFLFEDAQQESEAQVAEIVLEEAVDLLKMAESLQRRYLLTSAQADLAAYQQTRLQVQPAFDEAAAMQPDDAALQLEVRRLQALMVRQLELLDQAAAVRQQTGLEAATAIVGSEASRQLQVDIDGLLAHLNSDEGKRRVSAQQKTRMSVDKARRLILLGGLLSMALFGWAVQIMLRSQRKQRRVQAQLADSEAMSRAVTDSMAEGLVTATPDGFIVSANSAARQMFGHQLEAMAGHQVNMLLPARYRPGFDAFFDALGRRPAGFKEWDVKVLGIRNDGAEFPVNVSFGDVHSGGRRLFTAIIHDITESTRVAHALRDSEGQLRQLTDAVPALIAYIDKNERIQFHNRAYEELLGLAKADIHGKTVQEVLGAELYSQMHVHVQDVLAGKPVRYERGHTLPSGERREYVMTYFPRYGEGDDEKEIIGYFTLGTDISELKRIDRMKTEFVSTVSHELRTPLTSIRGSLGLVLGGVTGELSEQAKTLVGIAKNNCERLIRLINDILDSEKIESGHMRFELQALELEPLLESAIAANEGFAAEHKVKLLLRIPSQPVRLHIDSDRLIQVVTNMLSNAIKFSPPEGVVSVTVRVKKSWVRVEVRDTGPGIAEEFRDRIFQKFSQGDSSDTRLKGGTGLGLNISRAIIERMGGRIDFTSEVGAGSTFYFDLPEWREAPPVTAPASLYDLERPRILVCEDDPDVARLIGLILDNAGYDADIAHTAAQARDLLKMGTYAAMTVDLQLPYESGLDLVCQMRQEARTSDLPVVVVSVIAEETRLRGNHQALAISAWIDKPLDEQRLLQSLSRAVKRSPPRERAEPG